MKAIVRFHRRRGSAFELSHEERERLAGMSEAQIEAAANADVDNPPLTDEQLRQMGMPRKTAR